MITLTDKQIHEVFVGANELYCDKHGEAFPESPEAELRKALENSKLEITFEDFLLLSLMGYFDNTRVMYGELFNCYLEPLEKEKGVDKR